MGLWEKYGRDFKSETLIPEIPTIPTISQGDTGEANSRDSRDSRYTGIKNNVREETQPNFRDSRDIRYTSTKNKSLSALAALRKAKLAVVLAGGSFRVMGLENLPEDRRERCRRYCQEHEREILSELKHEEWYWKVFHLSWLRDAGLELSLDESGQVAWTIREDFQKVWDLEPEKRIVDAAWECWRYACQHRHEILAALQPCKGWEPTGPCGGCATLEEFQQRRKDWAVDGIVYCPPPFRGGWMYRKDCHYICGSWDKCFEVKTLSPQTASQKPSQGTIAA